MRCNNQRRKLGKSPFGINPNIWQARPATVNPARRTIPARQDQFRGFTKVRERVDLGYT